MTPAKIVNDNGADFRSVISNIADSVIIVDQEGNICFANPSAEALFGRSLEDLLGRPFGFPGIREQSTEIEVVSKGGESHTAEMRMTETVWEGKKVYLASIRDISELKRMEQRLRKQGHYLAERVKELNCLYSISKLIERQKISLEEIFQGTVELMHHAWQYPEITCARIILNGQEFATENFKETSWKQFSDIFVSGKKAGVLEVNYLEERPEDKEGPFSKGERGLIDAIVERLGHAIEKITAEEALRESENFLRSIIENIPDMIFVKNAKELRFVRFNKAGEELLGYSREKLIGKNDYDFFPKEEAAFFIEKDRDVLSSGKPLDIPEESIQTKDKGERILHTKKIPIINEEGMPKYLLAISEDITERKKLEEELWKAQKLEAVGILAGGIAHDFNNILTAIIGNISMARMQARPEDEMFDLLSEAEIASARAQTLTSQLLTFAKGGAPVKETTSIRDLLKASLIVLRGSKSDCAFLIADDLWLAEIDIGQMSQAVNNLVINANQAMTEGGTIQVAAENLMIDNGQGFPLKPGRYINISIKDQGVGIAKDHLMKLFDPYFTTKQEGSGLGLSTTYSIINKHHGHITVESQLGVGTTFHIYLPASGKAVPEKEEVRLITGQGRILMMDDEASLRKMVGRMLINLGYESEFAKGGAEAIRMYKEAKKAEKPYDVVILDLTIPGGMGGKEAIKKLQEIDPKVKAIASSGYSDDPVLANFQEYGFKGMMLKPFGFQSLSTVLHEVLKGKGKD